MRKFTLYWLSGSREVVEGFSFENALHKAGYGGGALSALDFYMPGDDRDYVFSNGKWHPI